MTKVSGKGLKPSIKAKLSKLNSSRSFKHSRFSRANLTIFTIIFAAIGCYFLFFSHAATLVGDINSDGTVNITDLSLLLSSYGQNTTQCVQNAAYTCDLSTPSDNLVNIFDLSILLGHWGQSLPTNTAPPVISGSAVEGSVLSTSNGTWSGSPTSYTYAWSKQNPCGPGAGTRIAGATGSSYTVQGTDVGYQLYSVVTAINASGAVTAYSSCTPTVVSATSSGGSCDLYASPSGQDTTGTGSSVAPFATLVKLETSLSAGQTGCLYSGTYGGLTTSSDLTKSGSASGQITIQPAPGDPTVPVVAGWTHLDGSYITLTGLRFDGANTFYTGHNAANGTASCSNPASEAFEIQGNYDQLTHSNLTQSKYPGVAIGVGFAGAGHGDHTVIAYNKIHDVGACDGYDQEIYLSHGDGIQVYDNWIWNDSHGYGVQIYPAPTNANVYSNVIDGTSSGFAIYSSGAGTKITHNVVTNQVGYTSVDAGYSEPGAFAACSSTGIASNNDLFNSPGGYNSAGCPGGVTFSSNLTEDPHYIDRANHNYTMTDSNMASWGLWDGSGTPGN
jgi:hypothetical protein